MSANAVAIASHAGPGSLRTTHALLTVQSLVIVLLSLNRLSPLALGYVLPNQFLRWVDFNNLLPLPLLSLVAFYLLKQHLHDGAVRDSRRHRALGLTFVVGAYLLGAGYGAHEVTNYLHARFCPDASAAQFCSIVIFNDDQFSHLVWFIGFVLINGALLLLQALSPSRGPLAPGDGAALAVNGLFIGAGIFANLAFETVGLDLYVVALIAALALGLLWRRGAQPLFVYYAVAYGAGLAATIAYKGLAG